MFKKHKEKEKDLADESRSGSFTRSPFRKLLHWKTSGSVDVKKQHEGKYNEARESSTTVSTLAGNQHPPPLPSYHSTATLSGGVKEKPQSNPSSGTLGTVDVIPPGNVEHDAAQRTWKSDLLGKGVRILRIIGEIAGVSTVDVLGPVERDMSGKTIGEFCAVLSGSIKSLMDKKEFNIAEATKDSFTSLCSDLSGIAKNVKEGNIKAEDAQWKVTNLLQMVLLENNLSGHISLDVYGKMENRLASIQDKAREDNLRQAVTNLPFANAAYNDYASTGHTRVTCFEGTRQELLREVGEWAAKSEPNIYVLFGLAGIGKTTIAQTVAKSADSIGLLGASFFFSRDDADRRTAKLFFTTIAFQLCVHDEEFADAIESVLRTEKGKAATAKLPLEQLETLILEPLAKLSPRKVIVVVDALDECNDEEGPTVLMGLYTLVQRLPSFKVVLTTRPQPYVQFRLEGQGSHKTFHLHNIDDKIVDGDIRLYLKYNLSTKAVQTHFNSAKEDWNASDAEIESLVQTAGGLFIVASTSVFFILDKAAHDPEYRMKILLKSIAHGKTPFDILNNFYTVILRSALPKGCDSHAIGRYQTVIGAIICLQIPLGIETLARLINSNTRNIHRVLEKLQPVILVDDGSKTPRVYHKSFVDYIQDPERCVDHDLHVDPKAHHTQIAICCFRTMAQYLKQNILELRDPVRFMKNYDARKEQGVTDDQLQEKISLDLQYACLYFANHIEGAYTEDTKLINELEMFANEHLLNWFETLSWIGKLDSACRALLIIQKNMKSTSPNVHQLMGDGLRFIGRFYPLIESWALHTYHSALPFTPTKTSLYNSYHKQMSSFCRVHGVQAEWDGLVSILVPGYERIERITFSLDNSKLAYQMRSRLTIHDATAGIQIGTIKGEGLTIACDFSKAAAVEDDTITLYRVKGFTPIAAIKVPAEVLHLEFSPDGSRLSALLADSTISVWDTDEGKFMMTSARWRGRSISVVASNVATGSLAITLDNDSIFVVDVSSCDIVATLDFSVPAREALPVSLAEFSGNGSRLACLVIADERSILILWNSKNGTFIGAAQNAGKKLAISNDGSLVATWGGKTLKLWTGNKGDPLPLIETLNLDHEITFVVFAQNDLLAAASAGDGLVILYDIRTRSFLPKLRFDATTAISFSSNCARLATADDEGIVYLWDVSSIKVQEQLSSPTALSFSSDCSLLASGHEDGSIKLWDTSNTTVPVSTRRGHLKKVTAVVFNTIDGGEFASGSQDGFIRLWDVKDEVRDSTLECSDEQISAMEMSGRVLIAATETRITLYDIETRSVTGTLDQSNTFRLKLSNSRSLLAVAFDHHKLIVWEIKNRTPLTILDNVFIRFGRMDFTNGDSKLAVQLNDYVKLFDICESSSDGKEAFKEIIVSDSQEIVRLGLGPCWHGIPVWVDKGRDVVGLFPHQTKTVRVLDLLYARDLVECGSSMIAYGHRDGSIFVIRAI